MPQSDRIALITGASRGIGRSIASKLASVGHPVILVSRSDKELTELRNEIQKAGGEAFAYPCDITVTTDVESMRHDVESELGPISILVNNAGIAPSAKLEATTDESWRETFAINVDAPFRLLRAFLPMMSEAAHSGHVVTIASTAALKGYRYNAAYTASKHAVLGLMRAVKEEYSKSSVIFSTICPGFVRTSILESSMAALMRRTGRTRAEVEKIYADLNREGKIIEPEEIAATVLHLVSAGNIVSGLTYHADGTVIEPNDFQ